MPSYIYDEEDPALSDLSTLRFPVRPDRQHELTGETPREYMQRILHGKYALVLNGQRRAPFSAFEQIDPIELASVRDEYVFDYAQGTPISMAEYDEICERQAAALSPEEEEGKVHLWASGDGPVYSPTVERTRVGNHLRAYFDHHHKRDKKNVQSTSKQGYDSLSGGRLILPEEALKPHVFHIRSADIDQDFATYVWEIMNWRLLATNPDARERFERFLTMENHIDIYAGLVPVNFNDPETKKLYQQMEHVFAPYSAWRNAGSNHDPEVMNGALREVLARMDAYVLGEGQLAEINTRYETIAEGNGWIMIDEAKSGAQARLSLINRYRVVISAREMGERQEDKRKMYKYTVAQVSTTFLPLRQQKFHIDLDRFCKYCNEVDGIRNEMDRWDGRKGIVFGSPRGKNTLIDPAQFVRILESFISQPPRRPTKGLSLCEAYPNEIRGNVLQLLGDQRPMRLGA